jgi:hypothetical protein
MNKYEIVIKVLSQVDHETLERLAEGFFKAYHYSQYLRYSDLREVFYNLQTYFSCKDISITNVSKDNAIYTIFGNQSERVDLERKAYSDVEWNNENENEDKENFDRNTLSIFNQLECCHCDDCHMCCYISVFFIEDFYIYCLEQNFIKVLIKESKNPNGKIKENKERKEENMDNLRTIAKNLVDNFYKYEEIISNLRDIGVKDERIYNIFYEILKNISE